MDIQLVGETVMEVEDEASNGREISTMCNSVAGKVRRCIIHMYSGVTRWADK